MSVTIADIYAAECEACRLGCLWEQANQDEKRLYREYAAAVARVRELVRDAVESQPVEVEAADPPERTLFDEEEPE